MRVFVISAMAAAVLAGCAPFQHGHYSEDVSYLNSAGDPPGTPLVYQQGISPSARVNSTTFAASQSNSGWPHHSTTPASNAFGAGGFPTASVSQPVQYSQPVSYSAPAPALLQQASVVTPTFSTPVSYQAPVQQVVSAPAVQAYVPPVQQAFSQPIRQSVVRPVQQTIAQPVRQSFAHPVQQVIAPPVRQTLTRASFVAPRVARRPIPTPRVVQRPVLATTHGGTKFDAEGYAICEIPGADHAALRRSGFKPSYQPASFVAPSRPQPQALRF